MGRDTGCDAMYPESVAAGFYTHLNFAFASIDPKTFAVVPAEDGDVQLYGRLTGLKSLYPNLKVSRPLDSDCLGVFSTRGSPIVTRLIIGLDIYRWLVDVSVGPAWVRILVTR